MSKKDNVTEQKTMTKYDLKMDIRKQAKEKTKRQERNDKILFTVIIAALICFTAYFPIRNVITVNKTIMKVNDVKISRVEYDYNYNIIKNNYGSYLAALGMDLNGDLSTMMFSENMTWQDYLEQEAKDSIVSGKALKDQAEAEGFVYDVTEDYKAYKNGITEQAEAAGIGVKNYIKQAYGPYATMKRIENYIKESLYVNAYYQQKEKEKAPTDEEIKAYYEADKAAFDSVDYYLTTITADVSTDEDVTAAMADAKVLAEAALKTVTTDGDLYENMDYSSTPSLCRDWLYDESRKAGDTTIIEYTATNQYYVLSFVNRYLDEVATVDARIIMTTDGNAQAILDEWKNGEATEESFAALADKYNKGTSFTAEGGFYEAIAPAGTQEQMAEWLFDASRVSGDATMITIDETTSYVLYYVGLNDLQWKVIAKSEIVSQAMEEYLKEISAKYKVEVYVTENATIKTPTEATNTGATE